MKSLLLLVLAISIALVAAVACGTEKAEEPAVAPTMAAAQPTSAPAAPTAAPAAPTRAAAAPTAAPAPTRAPVIAMPKGPPVFQVDPRTVVPPGTELDDAQQLTMANGHSGVPCWRGGCGGALAWVYGKVYDYDENGVLHPYLAASHTVNEDLTLWTVKLREDIVFQDGTPITAADIKAYWEHGAKPENIVAWGGASLALADINGWNELRAGDVTESTGLVVVDDHTLEIHTAVSPSFLWLMAFSHAGISKLEQVLSGDDQWSFHPIGAGPYKWSVDPDSGKWEAVADEVEFWGPSPIIKNISGLNVSDRQVQLIMFENAEIDFLNIDAPTYEVALDTNHHLNPLLDTTPLASLWYIKIKTDLAPLEDLQVRKALGHGVDMPTVVEAVWGTAGTEYATGLIGPLIPCFNADSRGLVYDPDLARQSLAESSYGSADNLPPLVIDLARPFMVTMGVAVKEYWKDNLGIELDLLKRESGMPRRPGAQFYRISTASYIPDPVQIVSDLTRTDSIEALSNRPGGYPVMNSLVKYARSLSVDHPDRCAAMNAIEQEYLDKVYLIPIRRDIFKTWVVQPWVVGFESTLNQGFNTVPWMYILQH